MDKRAEKWGVKITYSEMEAEIEFEAKHVINHAVENRSNEQEMAEEIKKYMDKKFFGGWYVVCGRNFGLDVTHEEGSFLRASKGPIEFIIYRCSS